MKDHGIELSSKYVGISDDNMFRWAVRLTRGDRVFETTWSAGFGHCTREKKFGQVRQAMTPAIARSLKPYGALTLSDLEGAVSVNEPTLAQVLDSLRLDAQAGDALLFEDFCGEFGYDTDSRKAESVWRACQRTRGELKRLLGAEFESFMAEEESE